MGKGVIAGVKEDDGGRGPSRVSERMMGGVGRQGRPRAGAAIVEKVGRGIFFSNFVTTIELS